MKSSFSMTRVLEYSSLLRIETEFVMDPFRSNSDGDPDPNPDEESMTWDRRKNDKFTYDLKKYALKCLQIYLPSTYLEVVKFVFKYC